MNVISNNKIEYPELLIINSLNKSVIQRRSKFNKTINAISAEHSQESQIQATKNTSIINLNTTFFQENSKPKKNSPTRKKNKSDGKKQPTNLFNENSQSKNRYPEIFRQLSKKGEKVKIIAKQNNTLIDQSPVRKFMKVQKLSLPSDLGKKQKREQKVSTKTLEKELMVTKKNASSFDYQLMMRQTIEEYNSYTKRLHDKTRNKKQNHKRNYSTIMESFSPSKGQNSAVINHKPSFTTKKYLNSEIPVRKPTLKKDYFVFGMSDRVSSENKIENYRDFLWKINYSNGLYVMTPSMIINPYKACIGSGNNSFLIKGILKRRYWWTVVEKSEIASNDVHFLWTQLKINPYFKKQNKGSKMSYETMPQEYKISTKGFENDCKIFGKNDLFNWKNHMSKNEKAEEKITENTYKKRVALYKRKQIKTVECSQIVKVHNHLETNFYIGNKKALFYNIRKYCQLKDIDPFTFLPLTFHISKGVEDPDYKKFIEKYELFEQEKKEDKNLKNIWIVKPGENTNRGNGITVCHCIDDIMIRLKGRQKNSDGKLRTFIIQKYLERPLLYHKRKFDIRHFMLVTCINGVFKGYWYEEGYCRTSSNEFSLKNSKDTFVHLTNDAIQKYCPLYGKFEKGNKLSYPELQKYLENHKTKKVNFYESILPRMKQIGTQSIRATYSILDENRKQNNFQLLGLDFMIDEHFDPWLIEVNTNPCLEMSCSMLQKIIPPLIDNVFKICLDPLFPPPENWQSGKKFYFGENPIAENKFQLVFDEVSDGQKIEKLYTNEEKLDSKMGKIEEDNEEFEDDGDEEWQNDRK